MNDPKWRKNILIRDNAGHMSLSFRDAIRCNDGIVSER